MQTVRLARRALPATLHVLRTKSTQPVQINILKTLRGSSVFPTTGFVPRYYSQQENADNLAVVDFNYVKKATSQSDIVIIDVREPDEIKEHGKIPNSVNIPLGTVSEALSISDKNFQQTFKRAKPDENTEIIFYCMIGKRSGKAQQSALSLGFKNSKNYLGSWTDWHSQTK